MDKAKCSNICKYINTLKATMSQKNLHLDGVLACSDEDIAESFNTFFHSVFLSTSIAPISSHSKSDCLNVICFSAKEVYTVLSILDPSKAMEIDGIGPLVLKTCSLALYLPIHHFTLSVRQHYIPYEWRIHKICLIFKSGAKTSIKNYGPISLLCTIFKVLEKLIYNVTIQHYTRRSQPPNFDSLKANLPFSN